MLQNGSGQTPQNGLCVCGCVCVCVFVSVCECVCVCVYLLKMFTQCDPQTPLLVPEHLTGHQAIENSRTGQRYAEVETKQPPVLGIPVELWHGETHFQIVVFINTCFNL